METSLFIFISAFCLASVQSQEQLVQSSDPVVIKPGGSHKLSCKGSGFSMSSYWMHWVRQAPGGGLQWLCRIHSGTIHYADAIKGRFTISTDYSNNMVYLQMDNVKTEDTAVYYCARYSGYFDIWGSGQMVTITSATQQAPSLFPLISCRTSQDSTITVGCLAKDFLPETIDFSWNDKSNKSFTNGLLKYKPVLQSTGTYLASSQIKVTADSWNHCDPYFCMAKHLVNNKAVKVVNRCNKEEPSSPVVTMHAPVKDDLYVNGNGTIVCVMSDFFPKEIKVKWFKNHVETTLNTMTGCVRENGNGKFALSSYITVSKKEWDEDTIFSCNVVHSGISDTRNLSKSQTCEAPAVPGVIQVAVEPPPFEAIFYNKKAPLTCIISNMQNTDGLEVSWHELGSGSKLDTVLDNPVFQGSSYSIKAIATVCADDWYNKKFECTVKHPDLTSPKKVILAKDKSQTPQKPTVYLFGPHQDELNNKESITLTCYAKGFYPEDAFIRWSRNDQVEDRYVVTTKPMEEPYSSVNKSYFLYSTLTLPSIEDWNSGASYTCMVGHEALPLQATQRSIDKTTAHILFIEEDDDIDNLWSTASTFIVLFLLSLFYSATVTVFKVK